jgi:hypothetical protein
MKSTPIVPLEAILCMPSIDTKIQEHAIASMHRLKLRKHWLSWSQMGSTSKLYHTMLCESIAKKIPETEFPCDFSRDYLPTESEFNTCIKSRKQREDEGFPEISETSLVCFTDGSRIQSSTGASYIAGNNSTGVIPLATHATVFQAEVMAILELADFLMSTCDREIHVFVDSLSVLHSLTTGWKTSSLVQECFQALQDVVPQNFIGFLPTKGTMEMTSLTA